MADVILLQSNVADGASAEGFRLRTGNTLSTGGAVVAVIENNGTDVLTLDKDGNLTVAGTITGTGGSGNSEFADDVFRIQDDGDASKEIAFQASGITTSTVRTITMPDADVDLGLIVSHAARHILGGADEIDGDQIDIDYSPTNYTPDTTPSEVTNVDHLSAHLEGISNALGELLGSRTATAVSINTSGPGIYGVTDTSAARTITLDTDDVVDGRVIIVKDESGNASTGGNPITVDTEGAETIDGIASVQITADYGVLRFYSDGTNWFSF